LYDIAHTFYILADKLVKILVMAMPIKVNQQ